MPNTSGVSRVSFDFRIIPRSSCAPIKPHDEEAEERGRSKDKGTGRFSIGGFYQCMRADGEIVDLLTTGDMLPSSGREEDAMNEEGDDALGPGSNGNGQEDRAASVTAAGASSVGTSVPCTNVVTGSTTAGDAVLVQRISRQIWCNGYPTFGP